MDEIGCVSWSSNHVGRSKSACLLWFPSMCETDEWTQRSNSKMGRPSGRKRFSQGHCTFSRPWRRKEMVRNSHLHTWRKMGFRRRTNGEAIRGIGSSSIQEHKCHVKKRTRRNFRRRFTDGKAETDELGESGASVLWVVEAWKGRITQTIHFTLNTELLFRTIHSANQLSIYRAVACWCEEFGLKMSKYWKKWDRKK